VFKNYFQSYMDDRQQPGISLPGPEKNGMFPTVLHTPRQ
jgi:hypothetical protein